MTKTIKRHDDQLINANLSSLHPVLARILTVRGINETREIEYGLENLLPFSTLSGIDHAVQCLAEALRTQSRILIIGDFDVDGATSSALAVSCLRALGAANVEFLVPNRFEFGYGLTPEIVQVALKWQPKLLITVDNGIANDDGVRFAKEHGLQVIITDHHLCPPVLPPADAIVNPNLPTDHFLSKNLAGVGVIFYVMLALRAHLRTTDWFRSQNIQEPNMAQFLDLVALGTMADVVKLDQNNRILIAQGLTRIRAKKCRPGILALLKVGKREANCITANDLSFAIAPRLNAAGRLDDMSMGINCLLAPDFNSAYTMAVELDKLNQERIQIEAQMQSDAHSILEKLHLTQNTSHSICLYNESWHQGVVGILATVKAIEVVDDCLKKVTTALLAVGGECFITADHGNAEIMYDPITKQAHTAHTASLVPLVYVGRPATFKQDTGTLADIAPSILYLMHQEIPNEMTGKVLLSLNVDK